MFYYYLHAKCIQINARSKHITTLWLLGAFVGFANNLVKVSEYQALLVLAAIDLHCGYESHPKAYRVVTMHGQ